MKLKNSIVATLTILSANTFAASAYIQDTGKIKTLYVNASGGVAIQLDTGFAKANIDGQCPAVSPHGFGGNITADATFKSALLAAKAAQQTISVTIQGCEASGAWFKIIDVYVN